MKFVFQEDSAQKVADMVMEKLGGRELGKIVSIASEGQNLKVVIAKMGTSELLFSAKKTDGGLEFALEKEKIAFTHQVFRGEVVKKFLKVIETSGGQIVS